MKFACFVGLSVLLVATSAANAAYSLLPYQTYETGSWADAVAIGDVDGDGRNDVVLTTTSYFDEENDYKLFVFFQKSDGSLDNPRTYSYLATANRTGLALADLDHDGRSEIIVGHGAGITIFDWNPQRAPMKMLARLYRTEDYQPADDVVVVDVDRNGALDVVGQSWSSGAVIYFGDGHGGIARQAFLPTPAQGYNDLESGDFNGDGHDDIVVLSGQGTTHAYLYYNDGSDDFSTPLELNPNPDDYVTAGALGAGDFNSDGREDLVIMRDRTHLSMYLQNSSGGLDPPIVVLSDSDPNAMLGRDLDLDGRDDLIVQHGGGPLGIYMQDTGGMSAEAVVTGPYATWFNTQGLAAGDINGDACTDIVTANYNYGLVVFPGRNCDPVADLASSLALTSSVVTLHLENMGTAAAVAPETIVDLSVVSGTLVMGALPAECTLDTQTSRTSRVTCRDATLAAGTSRAILLPILVASGAQGDALSVSASTTTTSTELRLVNNSSKARLLLRAFASRVPR